MITSNEFYIYKSDSRHDLKKNLGKLENTIPTLKMDQLYLTFGSIDLKITFILKSIKDFIYCQLSFWCRLNNSVN